MRAFPHDMEVRKRMLSRSRWPAWVYNDGEEPDYRFSLANERTFLAWIRTALALIAGGVVLDAVETTFTGAAQQGLSAALVTFAAVCCVVAWVRWAATERAMRRGEALPSSRLAAVLVVVVVVSAFTLGAVVL